MSPGSSGKLRSSRGSHGVGYDLERVDSLTKMIENFLDDKQDSDGEDYQDGMVNIDSCNSRKELEPPQDKDDVQQQLEFYKKSKDQNLAKLNKLKRQDWMTAKQFVDAQELAFYNRMRNIMQKKRTTESSLDKLQMFEIVDKHMNKIHTFNLDKECKIQEEKLGFANSIKQKHDQIQYFRKINAKNKE